MTTQIFALIIVVISFSVLFAWVFKPSNRARFEAQARQILDTDDNGPGEHS